MVKPKELSAKYGLSQRYLIFALYGFFAGIGALLTLVSIFGTVSESTGVSLPGLSVPRIFVVLGMILVALVFLGGAVRSIKNHEWAEKLWDLGIRQKPISDILIWVAVTSFLAGWIGYFLPAYRLPENLSAYFIQLKPIVLWFTVISALTLSLFLIEHNHGYGRKIIIANKPAMIVGGVFLLIFLLFSAFIAFSGFGLRIRQDYWYGAGVPVFGLQIILAVGIGVFVNRVEHKLENRLFRRFDVILCLMLWAITAFLWAREPLRHSFFMPGPYAPNSEFYPYSDGATFDSGSQFALIGQGLFNGQFFDRILYPAFLTVLHFVIGQNSERLMAAQAIIFAIFPVLVYWLGKGIYSRALGISAGSLIMLRGITSIAASTWIDLASPKMMLTDFPTAIGIVVLALLVIKWLRAPSRIHLMLWAGGIIGLTVMLRTHALLLLPVVAAYAIVKVRSQKTIWLAATVLLVLGMLAITIPWDYRNHTKGFPMFFTYFARIYTVLQQRYGIPAGTFLPPDIHDLTVDNNPSVHHLSSTRPDFMVYGGPNQIKSCKTTSCSVLNHFFHNLTTSVFFLPDSFVLHDLWHTVKENSPYWQQNWRGEGLGLPEGIFVAANLTFVALGLGLAWQRSKFIGLLPAVLFFTYTLSNALAQTSGGRYIVPVDWIVCLYFILGVLQLTIWLFSLLGIGSNSEVPKTEKGEQVHNALSQLHVRPILGSLILVFAIGALIPLLELPFPRHYQTSSSAETLAMLDQQGWLEKANLNKEEITNFLGNPQAEIILGRTLYPRYYKMEDGEPGRDYPYLTLAFPRLVFMAIGPFGIEGIILPGSMPNFIPQAADAVVLGCQEEKYLDALAVFVLTKPGAVYLRSPGSVLQCPLQEIYCENNVTCFPK